MPRVAVTSLEQTAAIDTVLGKRYAAMDSLSMSSEYWYFWACVTNHSCGIQRWIQRWI